MQGFKIYIFGRFWDNEFRFKQDPSIEIINNLDKYEIYEKPYLDFDAFGDLSVEFELAQMRNYCENEIIKIYQDNAIIWDGVVRLSDVKSFFNSETGSYKSVEVIDNNLNRYFKNSENLKIQINSVWNLECDRIAPPQRNTYYFGNGIENPRKMYLLTDVLSHVVSLITEDNVTVVSDFFTKTSAKYWIFGTGDQIGRQFSGGFLPFVSWQDLKEFLKKTYRLVNYHYQIDGVNYVRIEQWDYFFDSTGSINYDAVSNVKYGTKIDKLYSIARIGDTNKVDENVYDSPYVNFQYNTFQEQTVPMSSSCGSGAELNLIVNEILVDTEKIEFCLTLGDTDFTYRDDLFVVESDGVNATLFNINGQNYYNDGFQNGKILKRWFNGTSPITVFPGNFTQANFFNTTQLSNQELSTTLPSQYYQLEQLFFYGDQINLDPDNAITSVVENNFYYFIFGGGTSYPTMTTRFTCSKPGQYQIDVNWGVSLRGSAEYNALTESLLVFATIKRYNTSDVLLETFNSPSVRLDDVFETIGSDPTRYFFADKFINWESDVFSLNSGDYLQFCLKSNVFETPSFYQFDVSINPNSTTNIDSCSIFSIDESQGGKQFIYETSFEKYPLDRDQFNVIRLNPGIKQIAKTYQKEAHKFKGFIESLKYNLITGETDVKITGSDKQNAFGLGMTSSNMKWCVDGGIWNDVNFWIDTETWID